MTILKAALCFALLSPIGALASPPHPKLPKSATASIAPVHRAAAHRDLQSLRRLMVQEFVWSFGGDDDADQAIQSWRTSPSELRTLVRLTAHACGYVDKNLIQCPTHAGIEHRAGFSNTDQGWRMVYFLAGD
ncbi:hypothetical protein CEK69_08775 [Xanthomonas sp. LMG 12462]|uniref:hypothetical protein n=1 Tax=Xanthomonas sp. LMG 12462 TaxID=1591134 RepID=UPI00126539C1|nr:hypothetical protein [Xanthomonas sp. LMG 12462]KAB7772131.1 hypothetical protein CEK69_08775 [Xanthomonas sp. LMG 12462]